MEKIYVNDYPTTIEELIELLTENGEIDFDTLGAAMDSDVLEAAMDSFGGSYTVQELIEKYISLTDKPIEVTI